MFQLFVYIHRRGLLLVLHELAGWVRGMIVAGASEEAIRARWVPDVERYREKRVQYLLYE